MSILYIVYFLDAMFLRLRVWYNESMPEYQRYDAALRYLESRAIEDAEQRRQGYLNNSTDNRLDIIEKKIDKLLAMISGRIDDR